VFALLLELLVTISTSADDPRFQPAATSHSQLAAVPVSQPTTFSPLFPLVCLSSWSHCEALCLFLGGINDDVPRAIAWVLDHALARLYPNGSLVVLVPPPAALLHILSGSSMPIGLSIVPLVMIWLARRAGKVLAFGPRIDMNSMLCRPVVVVPTIGSFEMG
jgi:hypothetical protein